MVNVKKFIGLILLSSIILVGCGTSSSSAVKKFTKGNELAFYNFAEPKSFEEGMYGSVMGGVRLEITEGVYRIALSEGDGELWWGQWGEQYTDTVIDVDVFQRTQRGSNAFGVMCRVRGTVGSKVEVGQDVALLATQVKEASFTATPMPEMTQEATQEATTETTAEATTVVAQKATAEVTSEATGEATSEATSETTAEAKPTNTLAPTRTPTAAATATAALTATATLTNTPQNTPEATPEVTETPRPTYGEGDGYLFLIQGDGFLAIMRSQGRALTPLVDWKSSDVINQGPQKNHLRAVCAGDYLAFYINDQLVAEATDDTYKTGQVGLLASSSDTLGVRVDFDNLQVSEAKAGE